MGRRVLALAFEDADVEVIAAIEHPDSDVIGQDTATISGTPPTGVSISDQWPHYAAAVIDFSLPAALDGVVGKASAAKIPLVIATTGLSPIQLQSLRSAAETLPIVFAPSMSMAVNVTMRMCQQITEALKGVHGGIDVEILERHHRFKADAPSGTALRFGELIAEKMDGEVDHVHGREGETGARPQNQIGYHAIRVGDNPGEHTIVFGMMGERIEINVAASNRDCYAAGAIAAAKWIQDKPPGLYSMFDVLGFDDAS